MHSAFVCSKVALLSLVASLNLLCTTNTSAAYSFKILADTNQIYRTELQNTSKIKCDGIWSNPGNSDGNFGRDIPITEWKTAYTNMGPGFVCTEDYQANFPKKNYNLTKDIVGERSISMVCLYSSPTHDDQPTTVISDETIKSVKTLTSKKVMVLARAYHSKLWIGEVDRALKNPKVGGVCFEAKPDTSSYEANKILDGMNATLEAGKKCFLLLPPNYSPISNDYTADVVSVFNYIKKNARAALDNPNLYIVLTCYNRNKDKTTTMYGATNSVEKAIKKLQALRK